ncbi:hypothetical protein ACP275_11G042100 [Erythranthe tilingii]
MQKMAGESKNDAVESVTSKDPEIKKTQKKKGVLSRLWSALFRVKGDDFEKRLQYISKEEETIRSRMKRRSDSFRRMTRNLIIFSVLSEIIAVGYAIMTTRSVELNWKMRALRVLPMFLLPVYSFVTFSALRSYTRIRDQMDNKTLKRLEAEALEKMDELKEKSNYYKTQQLIQKYDRDPAAKAAAATFLAHKLGSDSGLRIHLEDEGNLYNAPTTGKSSDVQLATTSSGLRHRTHSNSKTSSTDSGSPRNRHEDLMTGRAGLDEIADMSQQRQLIVEHHPQTSSSSNDGGWIARLAALLVGEDPTQSYALICGNCYMHNGLARKEDYPYITYYCPHCHALNKPKQSDDRASASDSPTTTSLPAVMPAVLPAVEEVDADVVPSTSGSTEEEKVSPSGSPVAADEEISEM